MSALTSITDVDGIDGPFERMMSEPVRFRPSRRVVYPVGTVRTLTCERCGDVYTETWVAARVDGFRVQGVRADGSRLEAGVVGGCPSHPTHPGSRGPHAFTVEVTS